MYGLKHAPRVWNEKLNKVLEKLKFIKCSREVSLYRKKVKENLLLIAVYADDLLITGSNRNMILEFKKEMSKNIEMSDLGLLAYYLGIEVMHHERETTLTQERYARKILCEAGMDDCNVVQAPMEFGLKLSKADEEDDINEKSFRRNTGCLHYLFHTRPDLAFCVGLLSMYTHKPKTSHEAALEHVLRYLKGTVSLSLAFGIAEKFKVEGSSDSTHNINDHDGRSTTSHIFYLKSVPLLGVRKNKRPYLYRHVKHSLFMAATEAAKQVIWLQELLEEIIEESKEKVVAWLDNKSAIALTKNPIFHGRNKHIHNRYYFIRECVDNEMVDVQYIPGSEQKAARLTKALGKIKFEEMRDFVEIQDVKKFNLKFKGENVSNKLEDNLEFKLD